MKRLCGLLLLVALGGCQEKYVANVHLPATGFLVVEGFINVGAGSTTIRLTKATGLDSIYINPESGAYVEVESQSGASYPLSQIAAGVYSVDQLPIDVSQQYRIHIKTSVGNDYVSDYSAVKITPPIDSVSYTIGNDAANLFVSTHDDQNKTLYYQWQFAETWQYHAGYDSYLEYINGSLIARPPEDATYTCWRSDSSTDILIASSAKLKSDVIANFHITSLFYSANDKLSARYSILVTQIALTQEWYEWKEKIQKNTGQLGSIFDAQPSETGGNIHNTANSGETVIGYVGCTSQTQLRIFIDRSQLPQNTSVFNGYANCQLDSIKSLDPAALAIHLNSYAVPTDYILTMGRASGVLASDVGCVDCRQQGGKTSKPDFWQ